jgi:hypothetical protein
MKRLEEDSFIFSIPAKIPEAYQKTMFELQRRKAFSISIAQTCELLQNIIIKEKKQRNNFKQQYGLYLSSKILNDVNIEPMQPLFCYQENTVNQDFHFIKNIEVQ